MRQIIGQEHAVSLLQRSLDTGKMSHAYLFTGSEHIGKMTLALHLAKALNCGNPVPPCGECSSCRKIAAGNHPDVQIIGITRKDDGAEYKVIRIEQIEDLQHDANLPPFEGRNKVFIIDTAELLSQDAANRFLKTLEEPVPNVTFILLTVNEQLLPETVVSRCLRLELLPVPAAVMTPKLIERGIDAEKADLLARLSRGCPGWAIEASRDENLLRERDAELDRMLELIAAEYENRFAWAGQVAGRFTQNRKTIYALLERWLDYWRDLMLVKLGRHDMITNIDRKDGLAGMAQTYRLEQIRDYMGSIEQAGKQLRQNVNPRLALEVLMLDIPKPQGGNADNPSARISVTHG